MDLNEIQRLQILNLFVQAFGQQNQQQQFFATRSTPPAVSFPGFPQNLQPLLPLQQQAFERPSTSRKRKRSNSEECLLVRAENELKQSKARLDAAIMAINQTQHDIMILVDQNRLLRDENELLKEQNAMLLAVLDAMKGSNNFNAA